MRMLSCSREWEAGTEQVGTDVQCSNHLYLIESLCHQGRFEAKKEGKRRKDKEREGQPIVRQARIEIRPVFSTASKLSCRSRGIVVKNFLVEIRSQDPYLVGKLFSYAQVWGYVSCLRSGRKKVPCTSSHVKRALIVLWEEITQSEHARTRGETCTWYEWTTTLEGCRTWKDTAKAESLTRRKTRKFLIIAIHALDLAVGWEVTVSDDCSMHRPNPVFGGCSYKCTETTRQWGERIHDGMASSHLGRTFQCRDPCCSPAPIKSKTMLRRLQEANRTVESFFDSGALPWWGVKPC